MEFQNISKKMIPYKATFIGHEALILKTNETPDPHT